MSANCIYATTITGINIQALPNFLDLVNISALAARFVLVVNSRPDPDKGEFSSQLIITSDDKLYQPRRHCRN
jgi:hypothetical protein